MLYWPAPVVIDDHKQKLVLYIYILNDVIYAMFLEWKTFNQNTLHYEANIKIILRHKDILDYFYLFWVFLV